MMMEKYLFVLGKNRDLSVAEIIAYFKSRGKKIKIDETGKDFVLAETDFLPNIQEFGGLLKIIRVLCEIDVKNINIDVSTIFDLSSDKKIIFGVSLYGNFENELKAVRVFEKFVKKKLSELYVKSRFVGMKREISHVDLTLKPIHDIVLFFGKSGVYLGRTVGVHNPFEFQKRDIKRPIQRPIAGIPVRLAKIMINLSMPEKGDIVLDPFCGIGTILQEAVLSGFDARGLDIDPLCVKSTKINLKWAKNEYSIKIWDIDKKIIVGDARKISKYFKNIDRIVTEPYLGPPIKRPLPKIVAEKIIKKIYKLYDDCFNEFKKILKPSGIICIVVPSIKTARGFLDFNFKDIYRKHGFELVKLDGVKFPLEEKKQTLIRNIYLLKRC